MKKIVILKFTKYYTNDNKHTCALNFKTGDVCAFHGTRRMGTVDVCLINPGDDLDRYDDIDIGFVKPGNCCILK